MRRTNVKIPWSIADKIMTAVSYLALIVSTVIFFIRWSALPQIAQVGYHGPGHVDGYGNKNVLLILVIVGWFMTSLIFVFEFFPRTWNSSVKITYSNEAMVYRLLKSAIEWFKLIFAFMWSFLIVSCVFDYIFFEEGCLLFVVVLFVVMILYIIKGRRLRNV